ncbi:MAG: 50S ribosomal protein L25 [Nitrospiraceae bacterium]|nr:MAG: 50S ribosomal protein L25 [Nitrospiraceae bacterium]
MEKILLKADKRSEIGKGGARSLRRRGIMPAVMYSGDTSTPVKVNSKEISRLMFKGTAEHALITLELHEAGKKISEHPVLVKDYQLDPVTDDLLHLDFIEVSLKKKVVVTVPIVITKDPVGIKLGGIAEHHLREVEIECLPTQIPDKIEVDAGFIEIGQTLHVSDITIPAGVTFVTDPKEVVLNVSAPRVEAEPEEEAAEGEAAEPEVVGKGKEEEKPEEEKKE